MQRNSHPSTSRDDKDFQRRDRPRRRYHKDRQTHNSNCNQSSDSKGVTDNYHGRKHFNSGRRQYVNDSEPPAEEYPQRKRGRGKSSSWRIHGHRPQHHRWDPHRDMQGTQNRSHETASHSRPDSRHGNQQDDENIELDIPGFVYDKEKKRYFKIAPNHSQNPYSRDAIAKREAEAKRVKDLNDLSSKPQTETVVRKKLRCLNNLSSVICNRSILCSPQCRIESAFLRTTISSLRPCGSKHLYNIRTLSQNENLEHLHLMKLWKNHDYFAGLWSLKETWIQKLQIVKVTESARSVERRGLAVHVAPSPKHDVVLSVNKVTDMCWAQMHNDDRMHILYTTICHTGNMHSLAVLRCMDAEPQCTNKVHEFNLGRKATWACAWNRHYQQFSVGSEKCVLVVNVERRSMFDYKTNNSDPLAQVFSHQTGNHFYTGTRKGHILTFDCRSRSAMPVSTLHHKSSVCSLHLLQNDTHLIAADFSGKIHLWDLRQKKVVVEYTGNVNQYTKLPIHVEDSEQILYTVGEDGYTRFWCLKQGTLLQTVPPPCAVSRETIPCAQLSTNWGSSPGNAGVILGLENKLYMYEKTTDS